MSVQFPNRSEELTRIIPAPYEGPIRPLVTPDPDILALGDNSRWKLVKLSDGSTGYFAETTDYEKSIRTRNALEQLEIKNHTHMVGNIIGFLVVDKSSITLLKQASSDYERQVHIRTLMENAHCGKLRSSIPGGTGGMEIFPAEGSKDDLLKSFKALEIPILERTDKEGRLHLYVRGEGHAKNVKAVVPEVRREDKTHVFKLSVPGPSA